MTSYPKYAALVMSNGGTARDLTPTLFRQMLAGLRQKGGRDMPKNLTVIGSNWDGINLEELYEGDLRLTPADKTVGLAVASFNSTFGQVDVVTDVDAPYGKLFFADFSQIYRGVQQPLDWRRDGPGGAIFSVQTWLGTTLQRLLKLREYFIKERHTSGKITDLAVSPVSMY